MNLSLSYVFHPSCQKTKTKTGLSGTTKQKKKNKRAHLISGIMAQATTDDDGEKKEKMEFYHPTPIETPKPKKKENLTENEQIEYVTGECRLLLAISQALKDPKEYLKQQRQMDSRFTPIEGDIVKEIFYDEFYERWKTMVERKGNLELFVNDEYNVEIYEYLNSIRKEADNAFDKWSLMHGILTSKDEKTIHENMEELEKFLHKTN